MAFQCCLKNGQDWSEALTNKDGSEVLINKKDDNGKMVMRI